MRGTAFNQVADGGWCHVYATMLFNCLNVNLWHADKGHVSSRLQVLNNCRIKTNLLLQT